MSVPALLVLDTLTADEAATADLLMGALTSHAAANATAEKYYEGRHATEQFGISIPPSMAGLQTVAGWPGTTVDVIEERLDWLGWSDDADLGLDEVYSANMLDVDSGLGHLDALIFGTSFVSVGTGLEGEPHPLITPHSPKSTTLLWDARARRAKSALSVVVSAGRATEQTIYLPDQTITVDLSRGHPRVMDRDMHRLGRVPVVPLPNRTRTSREFGRSEITRAVRYLSDAAMRTLLGMEVNREFYSAPQRVALNVDESMFRDAAGNPVSQWTSIQGRVWAIPANDDGGAAPSVQQFQPASPAPYLDMVRGLAQLLAAEAGIPAAYLGFSTDNPASADAIRAGEARLVKRAERRQATFSRAWLEVARLALLVRDGVIPDAISAVSCRWRDASTPTRAAAADEVTKLVASGIIPAGSRVAMDRVGLGPAEQRQVEADRERFPAPVAE